MICDLRALSYSSEPRQEGGASRPPHSCASTGSSRSGSYLMALCAAATSASATLEMAVAAFPYISDRPEEMRDRQVTSTSVAHPSTRASINKPITTPRVTTETPPYITNPLELPARRMMGRLPDGVPEVDLVGLQRPYVVLDQLAGAVLLEVVCSYRKRHLLEVW